MSEINILAANYNKIMELTNAVNKSIIILKKYYLYNKSTKNMHPEINVSMDEVQNASVFIGEFLKTVISQKEENKEKGNLLPAELMEGLKIRFPYLEEDIKEIEADLKAKKINEEEFLMLDNILIALDNERTNIFRKLRTARG